ncbi:MAG TPA: DUF4398 domain-containing protein [Syntrophorhabdaceae bacterium]|nr:DUF4398 domain-containing protein [Syntrophorhabdaceae bacterium]
MNRRSLYFVFAAVIMLSFALFAGCSKPPTEEMTKADKAVEDARQKEAPAYVPDLFAKAEDSLKKAKDYVAAKKYKEAKQAAIETQTLAQQAVAGIEEAKTKMKAEADQTLQDVQKGIDDLKAMVPQFAKKKTLAAARDELQGAVTKWEGDLTSIKEKLEAKTKEAIDDLKAMKEQIDKKKEEATGLLSAPPAPPAKKK